MQNVGFLSSCLKLSLEEVVPLAKKLGFQTLEIRSGFEGTGQIDVETTTDSQVKKQQMFLKRQQVGVSALAFYENLLHVNPKVSQQNQRGLKQLIDLACLFKTELVSIFIGKNEALSIRENFDLMEEVMTPIVHYAEEKGVKIAVENCPMPTWTKNGYPATISYAPEFWTEMFTRIPSTHFGLTFDPAHLLWQQIDYLACLRTFKERIFHVHMKDVLVQKENLAYYGIFGKQIERAHPFDYGWYKPVRPGTGDVAWESFFQVLKEISYQGGLSIEFKDNSYVTNDDISHGLLEAKTYIEKLIEKVGT